MLFLDPDGLRSRFPWLNVSDLAGGSLGARGEGWLDPHSLLQGFRKKSLAQGVSFVQDDVVGISTSRARCTGVTLAEAGGMSVGAIVNAAGPRAAEIAQMAGPESASSTGSTPRGAFHPVP